MSYQIALWHAIKEEAIIILPPIKALLRTNPQYQFNYLLPDFLFHQMANPTIVEDQEALFSSPCAIYYVQSPSTVSHGNSQPSESALLSPYAHETFSNNRSHEEASRLTLSRYSSSRGSNNSFLHEKKVTCDIESRDGGMKRGKKQQRLRIIGLNDEGEDGGEGGIGGGNVIWKFVSLDPSSSGCCVAFQVTWRLMVSVCIALLVFFLATKPPEPKVGFKVKSIKQYSLREGLDSTGVLTNILTCNCSLEIEIDNYSKVFGLHISPSRVEIAFGPLNIAISEGDPYHVESRASSTFNLFVGAKNKPLYGAGRTMQDMLESGRGLQLVIWARSISRYKVVWNLVQSSYQHHAECNIVLSGAYDELHHTEVYNSTCSVITKHV